MDSRVLQTQEWLNKTYGEVSGFPTVVEDGITGNATFRALIYALQLEIGISKPDGVFGNDTLNNCPTLRESLIPDSEIPRLFIYYKGHCGVKEFLQRDLPVFLVLLLLMLFMNSK